MSEIFFVLFRRDLPLFRTTWRRWPCRSCLTTTAARRTDRPRSQTPWSARACRKEERILARETAVVHSSMKPPGYFYECFKICISLERDLLYSLITAKFFEKKSTQQTVYGSCLIFGIPYKCLTTHTNPPGCEHFSHHFFLVKFNFQY